ncbi:MAG TPA: hypothetical protein VHN82_04890 [Methanoregula sp.]|nr:hypothetical protein [Methanoregula sp.]
MGEKKKKEASQKTWKKTLFVIAAILFIVVMVVSATGTRWITGLAPIKAGDAAVVDYTVYDAAGTPFLTSSQQVYKEQIAKGSGILFTKQLSITANRSLNQAIYPIPVYLAANGGSYQEFALYNPEYNAISNGVVGMKTGEKKKIAFSGNSAMSTLVSNEELNMVRVNTSTLRVGDSLLMGVSETPANASAANATANSYLRLGQVSRITSEGAIVDFGYPSAEIMIYSISKE